jgi:hypothetical protein
MQNWINSFRFFRFSEVDMGVTVSLFRAKPCDSGLC